MSGRIFYIFFPPHKGPGFHTSPRTRWWSKWRLRPLSYLAPNINHLVTSCWRVKIINLSVTSLTSLTSGTSLTNVLSFRSITQPSIRLRVSSQKSFPFNVNVPSSHASDKRRSTHYRVTSRSICSSELTETCGSMMKITDRKCWLIIWR